MKERLFVDTSAWFAFVNRRDANHATVREVLRAHDGRLVTSTFVFDETVTLGRVRLGHATAVRIGETLRDPRVVDLIRVTAADEEAAWNTFRERPDQRYSFTDCVSFALMRRLGIEQVAALDDDFRHERLRVLP